MPAIAASERVPSGLSVVGDLHWGAHVCHFYDGRDDLADTLVPFFREGLRNREQCIWVTAPPFTAVEARAALRLQLSDLDALEREGQIEILDHEDWYARDSQMSADDVIDSWLAREAEALHRGFRGLRISGNIEWLRTPEEFASFAAYEARVHQAFVGRKIVALCSYALGRCRADEMVEVVRNHKFALIRQAGEWEVVRSATTLMVAGEQLAEEAADSHLVQLYDGDYPATSIARFLSESLSQGGAGVIIATADHNEQIRQALADGGADAAAALATGRLVISDAHETLEKLSFDGKPHQPFIERHLGALLDDLTQRFSTVYAFGEMVDLLAARGATADAVTLEDYWNDLLARYPARLLCGYNLANFDGDYEAVQLRHVCASHARVLPALQADQHHLIAELQHKTRLMRIAAQNATRLQEITAALAEASSVEAVARAVAKLASTMGASVVAFARREDALDGVSVALREAVVNGEASWPAAGAGGTVALPVVAGGRRLGGLELRYAGPLSLSTANRALHEDLARQVAVALERALLHEEAERLRLLAEESSMAKDEFLAMLGHELRNPLSPITTALHLMRLRGGDLLAKERRVIERHVGHMTRLVDDLLDVSRITRGKVELKRRPVELTEAIALAIEQASSALEQRAHRLHVSVPAAGLLVDADPARLAQAVANLLTNASKFTDASGEIRVGASCVGSEVVLHVQDDGIGIDADLLPRVFEMFVQGRRSHDHVQGGLGLGLALVKNLVEMHGGRVSAHSGGIGKGSRFTIRLPLTAGPGPAMSEPRPAAPAAPSLRRHVLVVDDNVDAAELLAEVLRSSGHTVSVAHDGPSALASARRRPPHVAILDIGLPVMDGYELATKLRRELGAALPYLVAVTGYGQESDRRRSAECGFKEHLVKPVDPLRIRDVINACK